jgi:hypothetical protein
MVSQNSPVVLPGQTYQTLLCGKSVTFDSIDGGDKSEPEWKKVVLEGGSHIIAMKEVSIPLTFLSLSVFVVL